MSDSNNGRILDQVRRYIGSVAYAPDETLDALTLACAVTHLANENDGVFTSLPRVLITSTTSESGKSVLLDVCATLSFASQKVAGTTQEGLRAVFYETPGATIFRDEISQVFGESGTNRREPITYDILNRGYTVGEKIIHSVQKVPTPVSIFGVAFMAGLRKAVPDDLAGRSIKITARKKPEDLDLEDRNDPGTKAFGLELNKSLHQWTRQNLRPIRDYARDNNFRRIHPKLIDRRKQVWYSLFSVAALAGDEWLARCRQAFVMLALGESDRPVIGPADQMVLDLASIFRHTGADRLFTDDLIFLLRQIDERPQYANASKDKLGKDISEVLGAKAVSMRAKSLRRGREGNGKGRYAHDVLPLAEVLELELFPEIEAPPEFDDEFEISFDDE